MSYYGTTTSNIFSDEHEEELEHAIQYCFMARKIKFKNRNSAYIKLNNREIPIEKWRINAIHQTANGELVLSGNDISNLVLRFLTLLSIIDQPVFTENQSRAIELREKQVLIQNIKRIKDEIKKYSEIFHSEVANALKHFIDGEVLFNPQVIGISQEEEDEIRTSYRTNMREHITTLLKEGLIRVEDLCDSTYFKKISPEDLFELCNLKTSEKDNSSTKTVPVITMDSLATIKSKGSVVTITTEQFEKLVNLGFFDSDKSEKEIKAIWRQLYQNGFLSSENLAALRERLNDKNNTGKEPNKRRKPSKPRKSSITIKQTPKPKKTNVEQQTRKATDISEIYGNRPEQEEKVQEWINNIIDGFVSNKFGSDSLLEFYIAEKISSIELKAICDFYEIYYARHIDFVDSLGGKPFERIKELYTERILSHSDLLECKNKHVITEEEYSTIALENWKEKYDEIFKKTIPTEGESSTDKSDTKHEGDKKPNSIEGYPKILGMRDIIPIEIIENNQQNNQEALLLGFQNGLAIIVLKDRTAYLMSIPELFRYINISDNNTLSTIHGINMLDEIALRKCS